MKLLLYGLLSVNLINFPRQTTAPNINSIIWATHDQVHMGENVCKSSNGTTAYECSFNATKALTQLTFGMPVYFYPDVDCTTSQSCTLNIDKTGIFTIEEIDGGAATLIHTHGYLLFWNGRTYQKFG